MANPSERAAGLLLQCFAGECPWGVLADWLDEHGLAGAGYARALSDGGCDGIGVLAGGLVQALALEYLPEGEYDWTRAWDWIGAENGQPGIYHGPKRGEWYCCGDATWYVTVGKEGADRIGCYGTIRGS